MKYNNFKEFMNDLKCRILVKRIKDIALASFSLRKDGWVEFEFILKNPEFTEEIEEQFRMKVHPSFAYGICQLFTHLNTMQQQ